MAILKHALAHHETAAGHQAAIEAEIGARTRAAAEVAFDQERLIIAVVEAPTPEEEEQLLELAAIAAHSSERPAAPLACWAAGKTGRSPGELRQIARRVNPA